MVDRLSLEAASGPIDAVCITDAPVVDGHPTPRKYVEVYERGTNNLIAWFGNVEAFLRWSNTDVKRHW